MLSIRSESSSEIDSGWRESEEIIHMKLVSKKIQKYAVNKNIQLQIQEYLLRSLAPSKIDVEKNDFMRDFPHFNGQGAKSYEITQGKNMNSLRFEFKSQATVK